MPQSDPLVDHCLELLAPMGEARARRMFGGYGLTLDGLFLAIIAFDRLYLKADDADTHAVRRRRLRTLRLSGQGQADDDELLDRAAAGAGIARADAALGAVGPAGRLACPGGQEGRAREEGDTTHDGPAAGGGLE